MDRGMRRDINDGSRDSMREESSTLLTVLRSAASIAVPDVAHADVFVLLFVVVVAVAIVAVVDVAAHVVDVVVV